MNPERQNALHRTPYPMAAEAVRSRIAWPCRSPACAAVSSLPYARLCSSAKQGCAPPVKEKPACPGLPRPAPAWPKLFFLVGPRPLLSGPAVGGMSGRLRGCRGWITGELRSFSAGLEGASGRQSLLAQAEEASSWLRSGSCAGEARRDSHLAGGVGADVAIEAAHRQAR